MNNPISKTAYYTLSVRAWDASRPDPVCNDTYAKNFMNPEAQKVWDLFKDEIRPNASNASRHAIIDQYLQDELNNAPDSLVVIVGAGFDTRAFRLRGGRWLEVDEKQIIDVKESTLPASKAPNQLTRLPIDFATEALDEKLKSYSTDQTVHVIIEGVFMYLPDNARQTLITNLKKLFPNHTVYCDLMRRSFFEKYGKEVHQKIISLGASFKDMKENPEDLFLTNGYEQFSCTSIPLYAAEHINIGIPAFFVKYFLKTLRNGYLICRFKQFLLKN